MFAANTFTIRVATDRDAETLRRLAEIDSQPELFGRVLIAEDGEVAVAALAIEEGRSIADPFRRTGTAVALLRMRASALTSYERTPSVRERIRGAIGVARGSLAYTEA